MSAGAAPVAVLVTGVGDTVGQAVIKAARASSIPCRVVGTDRARPCVGLEWVDAGYLLPHCSDGPAYLAELVRVCRKEAVRLILPGSEKELELLSRHAAEIASEAGATVAASPPTVLRIALDKLETCRFLERAGLAFPRYAPLAAAEEVERLVTEVGFPLVAKPVHGTGSRGLHRIDTWADLEPVRELGVEMVVQERLEPDDEEYSVSVFTLSTGQTVGAVSYRRDQLVAGDTFRARVARHHDVEAEALRVAASLRPLGPCNVQLRRTSRGPITFEINPRFSGGTSMRARFGYNEVEMAIRDLVLHQPVPEPAVSSGTAIRYWGEMYFDDAGQPLDGPGV